MLRLVAGACNRDVHALRDRRSQDLYPASVPSHISKPAASSHCLDCGLLCCVLRCNAELACHVPMSTSSSSLGRRNQGQLC